VLTLAGDKACAITWFGDNSLFPALGWPDPAAHAATLNSAARPKMMLAAPAMPEAFGSFSRFYAPDCT
jgi:hypothetical protein